MKIETKRLILRELKEKDKKVLPSLINNLKVSRYLAVVPFPYTKKDAEWFVEHCKEEAKKKPRTGYQLGIELKDSGELIGVVGLTNVNELDNKGTLGYWLGERYWRNGYMSEAVAALLSFFFDKIGLQRVDVSAATVNNGSNELIKKLGFKYEGTAKRYHRSKSTNEFRDTNLYGLLKEDWKKKQ